MRCSSQRFSQAMCFHVYCVGYGYKKCHEKHPKPPKVYEHLTVLRAIPLIFLEVGHEIGRTRSFFPIPGNPCGPGRERATPLKTKAADKGNGSNPWRSSTALPRRGFVIGAAQRKEYDKMKTAQESKKWTRRFCRPRGGRCPPAMSISYEGPRASRLTASRLPLPP